MIKCYNCERQVEDCEFPYLPKNWGWIYLPHDVFYGCPDHKDTAYKVLICPTHACFMWDVYVPDTIQEYRSVQKAHGYIPIHVWWKTLPYWKKPKPSDHEIEVWRGL